MHLSCMYLSSVKRNPGLQKWGVGKRTMVMKAAMSGRYAGYRGGTQRVMPSPLCKCENPEEVNIFEKTCKKLGSSLKYQRMVLECW